MSSEVKQALKKSSYGAIQAGFLTVASLFAWQGLFWPMTLPLYCMMALAYVKQLNKTEQFFH